MKLTSLVRLITVLSEINHNSSSLLNNISINRTAVHHSHAETTAAFKELPLFSDPIFGNAKSSEVVEMNGTSSGAAVASHNSLGKVKSCSEASVLNEHFKKKKTSHLYYSPLVVVVVALFGWIITLMKKLILNNGKMQRSEEETPSPTSPRKKMNYRRKSSSRSDVSYQRANSVDEDLRVFQVGKVSSFYSRKLLIIDLDETLIHTSTRSTLFTPSPPRKLYPCLRLEVPFPSHPIPVLYYVYKRPYAIKFLQTVSEWFDIAIYTASVRQYANVVIDILEKEAGIHIAPELRFFREHCLPTHNAVVRRQSLQQLQQQTNTSHTGSTGLLRNRRESPGFSNMSIAPVAPTANMFTKNIVLVAKRWITWRKTKRGWRRRPSASLGTKRIRRRLLETNEPLISPEPAVSSSEASTDVDDEVERMLGRIILLDNSVNSFLLQPLNGFPIQQWINDPDDEILLDLLPILESLRCVKDVRSVLGLRVFDELVSTIV